MSKVLIENSTLTNIAEAIRNQSGISSQMLPSEMPEHILNIDTEKVTVDGKRVKDKMELYSFYNQITLDMDESAPNYTGYRNRYRLDDGRDLCLTTTGSSNTIQGNVGLGLNGKILNQIDLPIYEIPSSSKQGYADSQYRYSISITNNNIFLSIERYIKSDVSTSQSIRRGYGFSYLSCYQLIINNNSLSWNELFIEAPVNTTEHTWASNGDPCAVVTDNGMYIVALNSNHTQTKIMFRAFNSNENTFETVSNVISANQEYATPSSLFLNNDGKTICCYSKHWGRIVTASRQEDGSHITTSPQGFTMIDTTNTESKWFYYKGNTYLMWLRTYKRSSSDRLGLYFYQVNDDSTGFNTVLEFSTEATRESHKVIIPDYGWPEWIFVGISDADSGHIGFPVVDPKGCFELYQFEPNSFNYQLLKTPTIEEINTDDFKYNWYLYKYIHNLNNYDVFYFYIEPRLDYHGHDYPDTRYKCIITTTDDSPLLYSTFEESDFI